MSVEFHQQNQVILFRFEGTVTESDIKFAVAQTKTMCDTSLAPVNFIVDTMDIKRFPPNILLLLKTEVVPHYHSNIGNVIVVTRNVAISRTVMFLCHMLPFVAIQMVHTREDAWEQVKSLVRS